MRLWVSETFCRNDDVFNNDIIIKREIRKRSLSKLEIPNSKIEIDFAYSIDFDEEKEDFEYFN